MIRFATSRVYLKQPLTQCSRLVADHSRCMATLASRFKSSAAAMVEDLDDQPYEEESAPTPLSEEIRRLEHIRNVGILAHVDAGKTTVSERMLALAGVVRRAGTVDDGNTVTDYLPAERERGITIQSAAISFEWDWHNNPTGDDYEANDTVDVNLIDTPGHVDFSVEVNRSVAVLDGAVLVVDAVAGVQAQTETVWRATTRPSLNNHEDSQTPLCSQEHAHEPLPCLALVNKMDKEGSNFGSAIGSLRHKLQGANPIPMQVPLFRAMQGNGGSGSDGQPMHLSDSIVAVAPDDVATATGEFVGVIDIVHMRAVVWPEAGGSVADVERCVPRVIPLVRPETHEPIDPDCEVTQAALDARFEFIEALAEVDEVIEECYLNDKEPSNADLRSALRRATLSRRALPVMAAAALKGKGVEPLMDAIADLLPSPLDRLPPPVNRLEDGKSTPQKTWKEQLREKLNGSSDRRLALGHPLHPSLLALAFKVVHMKGRGGSGDGRVVFARVYSGELRERDTVEVISAPAPGEVADMPRVERVGGMLELAGGRFDNLEDAACKSGDVCALIGLKSVVTGDTIVLSSGNGNNKPKKIKKEQDHVFLAGVASPKPVLKVRLETESTQQQARLSEALSLLTIEDPSLVVEETSSATMLSGLGELHIEVTLDRIYREFGLRVRAGAPSVAYRETITSPCETPDGTLLDYDRTIGGTRMQAAVHLLLEPTRCSVFADSPCVALSEPSVVVSERVKEYLGIDREACEEELAHYNEVYKALIHGCQGALKRGPMQAYEMANIRCHVIDVEAENGLPGLMALPGALRAAAANAVTVALTENKNICTILEPTMSVEIMVPSEIVGTVLSDMTGRRGSVGDILHGDGSDGCQMRVHRKSLVRGDVPLAEILGYASSLRSLTGGEGAFTAEYKGHTPCD